MTVAAMLGASCRRFSSVAASSPGSASSAAAGSRAPFTGSSNGKAVYACTLSCPPRHMPRERERRPCRRSAGAADGKTTPPPTSLELEHPIAGRAPTRAGLIWFDGMGVWEGKYRR